MGEFGTRMPVGFRSRTPSLPRASIIWLAPAVKVVRPVTRRLHLDRVRFAIGWHLGITLGVCMSGFKLLAIPNNFKMSLEAENYLVFTETILTYSRPAMHLPINIDDVLHGQTVELSLIHI